MISAGFHRSLPRLISRKFVQWNLREFMQRGETGDVRNEANRRFSRLCEHAYKLSFRI